AVANLPARRPARLDRSGARQVVAVDPRRPLRPPTTVQRAAPRDPRRHAEVPCPSTQAPRAQRDDRPHGARHPTFRRGVQPHRARPRPRRTARGARPVGNRQHRGRAPSAHAVRRL
ncbi:MAG: Transcriptional regulator, HxlR family, partial [uncultured Rubrobacteraceae bacterium]